MQVSPFQQTSPTQFRFPEAPSYPTMPGNFFFFQNGGAAPRQLTPEEVALREQEMEALGATRQKAGPEEMDAGPALPNRQFGSAQGVRAAMNNAGAPGNATKESESTAAQNNQADEPKNKKEKKNDRAKAGNAGDLGDGERQQMRESASSEARVQQEADMSEMEAPSAEAAPAAQVEQETSMVEQEVEELVQPDSMDGEPEDHKVEALDRTIGELEDVAKDPDANQAYLNGAREELQTAAAEQEMAEFELADAQMSVESMTDEMGAAYEARAASHAELTILRDDASTAQEEAEVARGLLGQGFSQLQNGNGDRMQRAQVQMTMRSVMDQVRQKMLAKRDTEAAVRVAERQHHANSNWAQDVRAKFQEAHLRVLEASQRVQSASAQRSSSQEKVDKLSAKPQPKFETVESHLEATRKERDEAKASEEGHQE